MTNNETLTVRDNRTGQEYEIPIADGAIRASDLGKVGQTADEHGLAVYDPGFTNTASTRSAVTFIDGDKGILDYRGYPLNPPTSLKLPTYSSTDRCQLKSSSTLGNTRSPTTPSCTKTFAR